MGAQTNIHSLGHGKPTKEHNQVEEIQACWELRLGIKIYPWMKKKKNLAQLFSRLQIPS